MFGLNGVPPDIAEAIDPRMVLARDRQVMLSLALAAGLAAGLGAGLAAGLGPGSRPGSRLAAGLGAGLVFGLVFGLTETKWTSYMLARGWLAFRRQLPWPLMAFLPMPTSGEC